MTDAARSGVTVRLERARTDDVVQLLRLSDEYLHSLYPPESVHGIGLETLEQSHVRVFVAREAAGAPNALGMLALVAGPDDFAELKRMFVHPHARGRGVGRRLVAAAEAYARVQGVRLLRLETGEPQVEAVALYRSLGFVEIDRFGPYVGDETSLCFAKPIG